MIGHLLLLIAFFIAAVSLIQFFKNTPKNELKRLRWKIGLSVLAIALILLAATGRVHWIAAVIGATIPLIKRALPFLIRLLPVLQHLKQKKAQTASHHNASNTQTPLLKMSVNHGNHQLYGEVISGPYAGCKLEELNLQQLNQLLEYCHQRDKTSAQLLITYLNQHFGHDWQKNATASNHGDVNEQSAYAILGLKKGASKKDVIQAHRRMMQKVHPDRGGSDYLATQINQAKDLLISKLT